MIFLSIDKIYIILRKLSDDSFLFKKKLILSPANMLLKLQSNVCTLYILQRGY